MAGEVPQARWQSSTSDRHTFRSKLKSESSPLQFALKYFSAVMTSALSLTCSKAEAGGDGSAQEHVPFKPGTR